MKMRLLLEVGPWSLAGEGGKVRPLARGVLWSLGERMFSRFSWDGEEGGLGRSLERRYCRLPITVDLRSFSPALLARKSSSSNTNKTTAALVAATPTTVPREVPCGLLSGPEWRVWRERLACWEPTRQV